MPQNPYEAPPRRWFQFSLRTMLVLMALASLPLAWVAYALSWISERHAAFSSRHVLLAINFDDIQPASDDDVLVPFPSPPAGLWLLGEKGVTDLRCAVESKESIEKHMRLFPEARFFRVVLDDERSGGRSFHFEEIPRE